MIVHRHLIIALAARHELQVIYYAHCAIKDGGLLSNGPSFLDQFQLAAGYVDSILRGEMGRILSRGCPKGPIHFQSCSASTAITPAI